MTLLLIPLILGVLFGLPFLMAWLEPEKSPTHRSSSRRRATTR